MSKPVIGLIGGTGLGNALADELRGDRRRVETPFGEPSAEVLCGEWEGVSIAFLPRHGEAHTFCPSTVPYRANIYALKQLGVTHIIASGATGSLREEMRPRDLVIADQVIDKTTRRASTFFDAPGLAVHVELAEPFCPVLRERLLAVSKAAQTTVHPKGTYICMEGPSFSTQAESHMHRAWGGDLIGMTCMPEAKLAREAEMCYALIALPTDYDCWRPHAAGSDKQALLAEILGNVEQATVNSIQLIKALLASVAAGGFPACTCGNSLDLAVWTSRDNVSQDVVERYGVLLDRTFSR